MQDAADAPSGTPARTPRKPRADALRNRERLLDAAREVFAAGGPNASLEEVARRAGFGIGTLYRHFPTREALFEAVYRREAEGLMALAARLAEEEPDPVAALRRWLVANVDVVATKKGMLSVLAPAAGAKEAVFSEMRVGIRAAAAALVARGVEAGALRADVPPEDVLRALYGFCYASDGPDWRLAVPRLIEIFVDGLRA